MSYRTAVLCVLTASLLFSRAEAAERREPLTDPEIDQLRDVALDPELRLKLYLKFARSRLDSLEKARSDRGLADRAQQIHDRLQDFLDVYDELEDNIDTYVDRKSDLRHALKAVIEADTEFQMRLRSFESAIAASHEPTASYEFLLSNALSTLDSSAEDHRKLLRQQEAAAKDRKGHKAIGGDSPSEF